MNEFERQFILELKEQNKTLKTIASSLERLNQSNSINTKKLHEMANGRY